jgi:hypothetical protein
MGVDRFKFQIPSSRLNRDYGATFDAYGFDTEWIRKEIDNMVKQTGKFSLYKGSAETYVPCRIRLPRGTNKIQVQVRTAGIGSANRPYGLAFSIYQIGLHKSLKAHIATYTKPAPSLPGESDESVADKINKGLEWDMAMKVWTEIEWKSNDQDLDPFAAIIDADTVGAILDSEGSA